MNHDLRSTRFGRFLVGLGVFLITAFVLLRLTILFGPAIVGGAVGYPDSGIIERASALLPLWLERVASYNGVSYSTDAYIYASSATICVLWVIVATLLLARARYARIGLFGVMAVALSYPVAFGLMALNELRFDYGTLVLCVLLAIIFTGRSVRVLFAREDG